MHFWKITAAGNDFVLLYNLNKKESYIKKLAIKLSDRHYGIGSDGILILNKKNGELFLKYFNSDGSKAFCGNGTRSAALWIYRNVIKKNSFFINTDAGKLEINLEKNKIFVQMPEPEFLKDVSIKESEYQNMSYIRVGTNHLVIETENINNIDVVREGRMLRYHSYFMPEGTNVDFVEVLSFKDGVINMKIRTYEKGVEDETFSCSSGISSAFYVMRKKYNQNKAVIFSKNDERFDLFYKNDKLFLSGPVNIVFKGEI